MAMTQLQLRIGHAQTEDNLSGCTVFLLPDGAVGSVDIRGAAPGTRDAVLLAPDKSVNTLNAVLFTGGSAIGLRAADGVVDYLLERDIGHPTPLMPIPIVTAAVVYDLFLSAGASIPDQSTGRAACENAAPVDLGNPDCLRGNVGAGAGVTVGKWSGFQGMMKSGFGVAGIELDGLEVLAAVVVNAVGDVVSSDGSVLAGARDDEGRWLVEQNQYRLFPGPAATAELQNTTLAFAATNARLDKIGANRVAQRMHDAFAATIRPAHTSYDGDACFFTSIGLQVHSIDAIGNLAVAATERAIWDAVRSASSAGGVPGLASD